MLLEIAMDLRAKGHDVEVVSWLDVDEYREKRYLSVPRHFLISEADYRWPRSVPGAAVLLKRMVESYRPDIIEIHTPTVAWVAAWANLKIPYIHVLQGYGAITRRGSYKDWGMKMLDRLAQYRLNADFIVPAQPMADAGSAHFGGISRSRFHCVPNGIDLSGFEPRRAIPDGVPTIMMLGTLSFNKGQFRGIRALGIMLKRIPDARLMIVGEGSYRPVLEDLVKEMKLEGKIEITGHRKDAFELMSKAHVFWHLSESEGLPMVVLEAMALGLPVVGFDVRGTRDVVLNGETGHLVPFGDIQAVAQKTVELLQDEPGSLMLSLNARRRVENNFTLDSMADGHERVLYSAIESRKASE